MCFTLDWTITDSCQFDAQSLIFAQRSPILIENFRDFPQFLQGTSLNSAMTTPSTSFPLVIHNDPLILLLISL